MYWFLKKKRILKGVYLILICVFMSVCLLIIIVRQSPSQSPALNNAHFQGSPVIGGSPQVGGNRMPNDFAGKKDRRKDAICNTRATNAKKDV